MNKINMLQDKFSAGEYLAPKVKVVEVKARRVMCFSGNGTEVSGEGDTNDWY